MAQRKRHMDEGHYEGRAVGLPGQPAPPLRRPPVRPEPVVTTQEEFRLPPEILRALQLSKDLENPLGPRLGGMPQIDPNPRGPAAPPQWLDPDASFYGEPSVFDSMLEDMARTLLPDTPREVAIDLILTGMTGGLGAAGNKALTGRAIGGYGRKRMPFVAGEAGYGPRVMDKVAEHMSPGRIRNLAELPSDADPSILNRILRSLYPNKGMPNVRQQQPTRVGRPQTALGRNFPHRGTPRRIQDETVSRDMGQGTWRQLERQKYQQLRRQSGASPWERARGRRRAEQLREAEAKAKR